MRPRVRLRDELEAASRVEVPGPLARDVGRVEGVLYAVALLRGDAAFYFGHVPQDEVARIEWRAWGEEAKTAASLLERRAANLASGQTSRQTALPSGRGSAWSRLLSLLEAR